MSTPVEIHPIQGSIILRRGGSELLIQDHHVAELATMQSPRAFSDYFLREALVNRPARKLFEAWIRKDGGLWNRLYKTVGEVKAEAENTENVTESAQVAEGDPTEADGDPKAEKP